MLRAHRHPSSLRGRGFTLIELLVVLVLLSVLLTLAAPSFIAFQRNSELTSAANSFVAALSAARSEAMKRQMRTFVVPKTAGDWSSGWRVYVDVDNSSTTADLSLSAGDVTIAEQDALPSTVTLTIGAAPDGFSDSGARYAMFNGSGFMTLVNNAYQTNSLDFTNGSETRRVIASPTGRLRVCKPADAGCDTSSL